ncbi:hypothetical protein ACX9NE_25340 [Mycobacterium sp. ML4]
MSIRAVLVCHQGTETGPITAEWTYWADVEEARQAEAELARPCGPLCIGVHTIVRQLVEPDRRRKPPARTRT